MAFTAPVTRATDFLVTAAVWNAEHVDNLNTAIEHLIVRKPSDETVPSSTTLQNDDHLLQAVSANTTWRYRWTLVHSSAGAGDIKIAFTVPTSAVMRFSVLWLNTSNAATIAKWDTSGTAVNLRSSAVAVMEIVGHVAVAGTAGNVQLQWAQATSDASGTIVAANSCLFGVQIA